MSVPNKGGPAFPPFNNLHGMYLRDHFASGVLPAVYQARVASGLDATQESIAAECYELADAMLDERERAK